MLHYKHFFSFPLLKHIKNWAWMFVVLQTETADAAIHLIMVLIINSRNKHWERSSMIEIQLVHSRSSTYFKYLHRLLWLLLLHHI